MGWLIVFALAWFALVGLGLRPRHALILILLGVLFAWMLRFGLSMLLRSLTGFALLGVVIYLFVRFWGQARPKG